MPYGPKSIAKDLRPINVVRNVNDETRMAPVTSSGRPGDGGGGGYYTNQSRDVSGNISVMPQAQTVYYQSTVPDSPSFLPLGYNSAVPGVAAWVQHVVPSQPSMSPTVVSPMVVTSASGFGYSPTSGGQSEPASEDGGDDSVSGRKVKFLCSFGGKILPRPSDSSLRYVGGQTRILSVRRDISFGELVQKMMDTYGQDVVIKYQLPEEELDALVSVACADDVENMMDEYEKLAERSSDGSAKLRIFLFSPSDVDSPVHIGERQDGGCRYVEAVNGVMDNSDGGRMVRNESIENAAVGSQTSDVSASEEIINVPLDTSPRMVCVDPNPVLYTDVSGAQLSIPRVQSGQPTVVSTEQVVDRSVPFTVQQSQPAVSFPVSSQYMPAYPDPRQEAYNRAAYMQLPTQMGYHGQILGPMYAQQSIPLGGTGVPSQMFNPTAQMTMSPSFVSMKPSAVPVTVQSQQVHMDHYPAGSMVSQRVVQFTTDQGFSAPRPQQVPSPVQGGLYNWHQVQHLEPTTFLEDCIMCQKQLPHAHSDTVAQELKESCPSISSDSLSSYHSLRLDNRGRPLVKPVVNDIEQSKVTLPRGAPSPYGPFVANSPQACQVNPVQQFVAQPQVQVLQDTDQFVRDSSKDYYGANVAGGSPNDDSNSLVFDHLRQIDGRLENLQIRPSEILSNNEQNKAIADIHQAATRENPGMKPLESYEVIEQPPSSNPDFYPHPGLGANQFIANDPTGQPIYLGEDNISLSQPIVPGGIDTLALLENNLSSISPSYGAGDVQDNSASLFSNQDPWNLRHDTQFPPPKPSAKSQIRKENPGQRDPLGENRLMNRSESPTGNGRDSPSNGSGEQAGNLNRELSSNKGSEEEIIKQELQAVAEGVAASVLHSSGPSNADQSVYGADDSLPAIQQNGDVQRPNVEVQRKDKETKTKSPDKVNLGSTAADSAGRLQVIRNSDLEELRELGSGTFGTVYHGKWRGTDVAIKRISDRCFAAKPSEQERMRDDFWNEAVNLADLHHPNVVAFYGVVLDGPEGSVATVTEFMVNGSLRNALQKNERLLDKRKRLLIGMDAAFGMEYLHGKNIVHFDLKSDNLLVNLRDPHRPICKVGDLGLSKVKCQTLISGGVRGTLPWMAPELLNGSSSLVSEKVDVFSFGIVMWELLTGEEPYADLHYGAIIGGIVSNTLRPLVPETCDPVWRALMEKCWASEPSERPNFTEIANELRAMAAKQPAK